MTTRRSLAAVTATAALATAFTAGLAPVTNAAPSPVFAPHGVSSGTSTGTVSQPTRPARDEGIVATGRYLVLGKTGASVASVRAAIAKAGGRVIRAVPALNFYTVTSTSSTFASTARRSSALQGVARDRAIGRAPDRLASMKRADVERPGYPATAGMEAGVVSSATTAGTDPLVARQWDMKMIRTTAAQKVNTGRGVRVGVMDTGVDATHPDIASRFDRRLSRNFTHDIPSLDGACSAEPDRSCADPATVDENGHGTHVAGTMASPKNGRGIVGVAPDATIVNLRVGQDSGYFFTGPTVDALVYAATHGIDVVNMSYYIDPWLFNCANSSGDSAEDKYEQRLTMAAVNRAMSYAVARGVTPIVAAGNEDIDLDAPTFDVSSPDIGTPRFRYVDNTCLVMPTEATGAVAVSSVTTEKKKASYSSYGQVAVEVSAPGGDTDFSGTPKSLILAPMPKSLALATGMINPSNGGSLTSSIVAECPTGKASCAYYQYMMGTSMAAPHAAGVAALIVGRWGSPDRRYGGKWLRAHVTTRFLMNTATPNACLPANAGECTGPATSNSYFGDGIVDAYTAVTKRG